MQKLKFFFFAFSIFSCGKVDSNYQTKDQLLMNEDGSNIYIFKNEDDGKIYIAKCGLSDMAKLEQWYQGYENMDARARYATWVVSQRNQCHTQLSGTKGVDQDTYLKELYDALNIGQKAEGEIINNVKMKINVLKNKQESLKNEEIELRNQIKTNGVKIEQLQLLIPTKNDEILEIKQLNIFLEKKIQDNPNLNPDQLEIIRKQINSNLAKINTLNNELAEITLNIDKLVRVNEREIATRIKEINLQISSLQTEIDTADDHVESEILKLKLKRDKYIQALEHGKFNFPEANPWILRNAYNKIFSEHTRSFCTDTTAGFEIPKFNTGLQLFENKNRINILDQSTVYSAINIESNAKVNVDQFKVSLNISHTHIHDLIIDLISPKGTTVRLHNGTGGDTDNIIATFTDKFASLKDEPLHGEWRLKVQDKATGDVGTIDKFSISNNFTPTPETFASTSRNLEVTNAGVNDKITISASKFKLAGTAFTIHFPNAKRSFSATLKSPTGRIYPISTNNGQKSFIIKEAFGDMMEGDWTLNYKKDSNDANYLLDQWSITNEVILPELIPNKYEISSKIQINNGVIPISSGLQIYVNVAHQSPEELIGTITAPSGKKYTLFSLQRIIPNMFTIGDIPALEELIYQPMSGEWKLEIQDVVYNGTKPGLVSLTNWSIKDSWCGI